MFQVLTVPGLLLIPHTCTFKHHVPIGFLTAMTDFIQQREHFLLDHILPELPARGCESFLSTTVSCAFHVVLSHSPPGIGHVGQPLPDVPNEHILSSTFITTHKCKVTDLYLKKGKNEELVLNLKMTHV